jgi:hypothetical protein
MMTLNELAKELQPDVGGDEVADVLIWREGRQWNFELLYAGVCGEPFYDKEDIEKESGRVAEVRQIDPDAIVVSSCDNFAANTQAYIMRQVSRLYESGRLDRAGVTYCYRCMSTDVEHRPEDDLGGGDCVGKAYVCLTCGAKLYFAPVEGATA